MSKKQKQTHKIWKQKRKKNKTRPNRAKQTKCLETHSPSQIYKLKLKKRYHCSNRICDSEIIHNTKQTRPSFKHKDIFKRKWAYRVNRSSENSREEESDLFCILKRVKRVALREWEVSEVVCFIGCNTEREGGAWAGRSTV